jgi:hypothetical protein
MISPDLLADLFTTNYRVIRRQADGLTHEDSLLQPPFRGNCLNWIVGHIVATRNQVLSLLGEPPVWSETEAAPYVRGSAPITDGIIAHPLEKILSDLDCSQERLTAALRRATPQDMDTLQGDETVGQQLAFLHFHEAYHTGQTEQLRQLAGKNDRVI